MVLIILCISTGCLHLLFVCLFFPYICFKFQNESFWVHCRKRISSYRCDFLDMIFHLDLGMTIDIHISLVHTNIMLCIPFAV